MKRLNFEKGVIAPFWLQDLEYMQQGFEEAIKAVIEGLSLDRKNLLISGCKISQSSSRISMTAGWCYYDGEILPVRALPETSYTGSPKIQLTRRTEYDLAGTRSVKKETETMSLNVYQMDYLVPSLLANGSVTECRLALSPGAWDLGTRIANMNKIADTGVVVVKADTSICPDLRYRQIGGTVQLYGIITKSGKITENIPLPTPAIVVNTGKGDIKISPDGLDSLNVTETIRLDGITYFSDVIYDTASDGHYSTVVDNQAGGSGGTNIQG